MFAEQVMGLLREKFPLTDGFACRTLKTTGLGESLMEECLSEPLQPLIDRGLELGFCARVGEVDVRFVGRGTDAAKLVSSAEEIARKVAGPYVFGRAG
jgi:molybdopterin-biosynthesis enzyme MoeA-like protein